MDSEKITRARETALSIIETMEQDEDLRFSLRVALPQAVRVLLKALELLDQDPPNVKDPPPQATNTAPPFKLDFQYETTPGTAVAPPSWWTETVDLDHGALCWSGHHIFTCGTCGRVCQEDSAPKWTGQYTCSECAAKTS